MSRGNAYSPAKSEFGKSNSAPKNDLGPGTSTGTNCNRSADSAALLTLGVTVGALAFSTHQGLLGGCQLGAVVRNAAMRCAGDAARHASTIAAAGPAAARCCSCNCCSRRASSLRTAAARTPAHRAATDNETPYRPRTTSAAHAMRSAIDMLRGLPPGKSTEVFKGVILTSAATFSGSRATSQLSASLFQPVAQPIRHLTLIRRRLVVSQNIGALVVGNPQPRPPRLLWRQRLAAHQLAPGNSGPSKSLAPPSDIQRPARHAKRRQYPGPLLWQSNH
jgi:hypothetical protein